MSVFTEDLTKDYFCEQCAPENHKETLAGIAKGEKPWEGRRQKYEDDKKRKKGKKGKGKRVSDTKDRASPAASTSKAKASPTPDVKKEEVVPEPTSAKGKRKSRDHSQGPQSKHRKVTETQAAPVYPKYTPPSNLPDTIQKLEGTRKQHAVALQKSLDAAVDATEKKQLYKTPTGTTKKAVTERLAIEIERAFHDAHQNNREANAQLRRLVFNLKSNLELAASLLNRILPPPSFVVMTGDELATKELQRENAEMKARAEKQSILPPEEISRVRRTHKGDEIVESDNFAIASEEAPSALRRQSTKDGDATSQRSASARKSEGSATPGPRSASAAPLRVDTQAPQYSPKANNFDIGKVFSSVKSPSGAHRRRSSAQVPSAGPGEDADVDRLLRDDGNESPPYSPTEDLDPDIVWRGPLSMTNVADITTVARYMGGADLSKVRGIPWKELIPPVLTVAGRIPEEKAIPYLCGLRYNNQIDLVITSLQPANISDQNARTQFLAVIDYFRNKKRYGVVGERKLGNVRDTYLIPVSEGDGPIPEPMQNIGDHLIPQNRTEPLLLMVFVVRDEKQNPIPADQQKAEAPPPTSATSMDATPSAPPRGPPATPSYSPATPHPYHPPNYNQTPIPPPAITGQQPTTVPPRPATTVAPTPAPPVQQQQPTPSTQDPQVTALRAAQAEGERKARQVLGPLFASATVTFLLPHAARMKEGEWNAVKRCLERDHRARDDLQLLSKLLTEEGNSAKQRDPQVAQAAPPPPPNAASPGVVQSTLAAAAANQPGPTPQAAQPKA